MSRSSILIAGALALGAAGWLASGMFADEPAPEPESAAAEMRRPLVAVEELEARPVQRFVTGQGEVEAFRRAAARSQSDGRVADIFVNRGDRIERGAPILSLTLEGLDSRLREAKSVLARRQSDYDTAARLQDSGLTTATQLRELDTLLQSAREEVSRLEEDIANATIRAPFAGLVDDIMVESGEYVSSGAEVAVLVDSVPLRTTLRVSQLDRSDVELGRVAEVAYATGETEVGRVCFVSAAADPRTRTFQVEVRTPNVGGSIPSGISAEVSIPTDSVGAYFVSPATLSLGTDGTLGLKTVDGEKRVGFHPVEVVRADAAGLWVTGLPSGSAVITLGHGFVQAGDIVDTAPAGDSAPKPPATRAGPVDAGLPDDLCSRTPTIGAASLSAAADEGDSS